MIAMDETLSIEGAADFLHIHRATLLEIAGSGEIPHAAKIGRAWVFLKSGLIEYIKQQAATQNKMRRAGKIGNTQEAANETIAPAPERRRGGPRRLPPALPDLPEQLQKKA